MWRLGTARAAIFHSRGLGPVGALLLAAGCGQTSAAFDDDLPSGTAGGGMSAGGNSAGSNSSAGARAGHGGLASGGSAGSVGGSEAGPAGAPAEGGSTAGTSAGGGGSSSGGSMSEAGTSGGDPLLGVDCRDQRCVPGNVCVVCSAPSGLEWLCVPHPVTQPAAHAEATAQCEPQPAEYDECDGPEDCQPAQYCVARQGIDGGQRCRDAPSPVSGSCCFTCGALPNCTLCREDSDCPEGRSCVVVFEDLKGCKAS